MPRKVKKIALDIVDTSFIENYRLQAYYGVIRYAREHTSWRLMFNIDCFSLTNKFAVYEDLPRLGADGLIFLSQDHSVLDRIVATRLPAVSITNVPAGYNFPSALSDDVEVGRLAAHHMIERGFRYFGFCGSHSGQWAQMRLEGYRQALNEVGLDCEIHSYDQQLERNYARDTELARELRHWIDQLPKPVAIMGDHDTRALHILEACQELELEVPGEVAILGVDNNVMICDSRLPSLSSVEQNSERVGYEAASLLDRMLSNKRLKAEQIVVPPKGIVTRMSSDILAVDDPALATALLYIRDHLSEPFGIVDVVRASGISRSNLENRFRLRLKRSINQEIRIRRLKKAQQMLRDTMLSMEEIAKMAGFRRATYFSNFFAAQTGMSPGSWRRQHRPFK